jgi:hypothetical protein
VTGVSGPLIVAVLLLLLILVWVRAALGQRDLLSDPDASPPPENGDAGICPPEFVSRIFAGEDLEFISRLELPHLEKFFRRERNAVALLWVQQTTAAIRRIMRQHLESSRRSKDLKFETEARIFVQYAQLRFICGVLFVSIELVGPERLRGLAMYAEELTEHLGHAQLEFDLVR